MRKYIFVCLFLTLFLFLIEIPAVNSAVLAPGSTVEGKTIGEWTAEWWKWAYSQTVPNDAFTDTTGANAAVGQTGPVFFIAGTTGGTATRSFTVPGDKFILVPLINVSFSEVDYGGQATEEQLRIAAATLVSLIDSLIAEIDGIPVPGDLFSHRELSPLFSFVAATDNPFGFPLGPSGNAVADGYWLMLEPLGEGTHTIRFGGGASDIGFTVEVTDTISAVSPDTGCTQTQGYWKTHSEYGPAPYDDTWSDLPDGADTPIFEGGPSYYEVLWTEPKGGNAYFLLAQQYIAFELNVASGASVPYDNEDLREAVFGSLLLLDMYKDTLTIPKKSDRRELALKYAKILDDYNNGYIGPGSCECPCWTEEDLASLTASSCVQSTSNDYVSVATYENYVLSTSARDGAVPECNVLDYNGLPIGFARAITYEQFLDCRDNLEDLIGGVGLMCSEPLTPFTCSPPITSITMIWNGSQSINVVAWNGTAGSSIRVPVFNLTSNVDNSTDPSNPVAVSVGDEIMVTGLGANLNSEWEIFSTGLTLLGKSSFDLSCSDSDMSGPGDCGKSAGDGQSLPGFINEWIFEGMISAFGGTLDCTPN